VWATIKLPEILSGFEAKDFRKMVKQGQKAYKESLDQSIANQNKRGIASDFQGMSDAEILLNYH